MNDHTRHSDTDIEKIREDLAEVKAAVLTMKEIIEAWNDAKGFVRTIKLIGEVFKWVAKVAAAIGAVWLLVKTGQWIKP